jgi:hypothetical protein
MIMAALYARTSFAGPSDRPLAFCDSSMTERNGFRGVTRCLVAAAGYNRRRAIS